MVALEEVALHTVNPSTLALAQNGCPVVSAHRRGNHSKNVEVQDVKCQEPVYCVKCRSLRILILQSQLGPKKYQKIARMYDHACLSTKCTLIKTGFKNLRSGTEAKFRPFVDALVPTKESNTILLLYHSDHHLTSETLRCDYYWPTMRAKVTDFIRACHP